MYIRRSILIIFWFLTGFLIKFGILVSRTQDKLIILKKIKDNSLAEKVSLLFAELETNINKMQFMGDQVSDGSYPVPRSLNDTFVCLSAGVGPTSIFEEDLANTFNIRSYMIDGSVEKPPLINDNFYFEKLFLTDIDTENTIKVGTWIKPHNKIILQIDIEGWEYSVLSDINTQFVSKVSVLIVEFHYLETFLCSSRFATLDKIFSMLHEKYWLVYCRHNPTCPRFIVNEHTIPNTAEVVFLNKLYWEKDGTPRIV